MFGIGLMVRSQGVQGRRLRKPLFGGPVQAPDAITDTHGRAGDTTKSENGRDQSDNQKRDDEAQHRIAPRCRFEL